MGILFRIRGYLPYLLMVFLNAFVDLGHKIIVQNTIFKIFDGQQQIILTAVVNGLILLPFIFLFSPAGYISDKYPKERVIRYSAWLAVFVTLLITASYYAGWFLAAFALTLLLAIQSAIYSPAKYGYIRALVGDEHLTTANGMVQALTIFSILVSTFVFSGLFEWLLSSQIYNSPDQIMAIIAPLGWGLVGLSLIELTLAYRLPKKSQVDQAMTFSIHKYVTARYLKDNIQRITSQRTIWLSIIGLSMFWAISQVVLAAFPAFAKEVLEENNTVLIQGILACAGVGVVIGSLIAGSVSNRHLELGMIPVGAVGITVCVFILASLDSYGTIVSTFLALGVFGGLFIVPLNALIQYHAKMDELGVVLAGSNWFQTLIMALFLVITAVLASVGVSPVGLFYLLGTVAVLGTSYTISRLPQSFLRIIVTVILKRRYRMDIIGFDHLPHQGGVLLLGNHISWLDWAFVQIASPRPVKFVVLKSIYNKPVLRHFFDAFGAIPISSSSSKEALREINQLLKNGEVVCLFPEGSISRTGQLGEFKRGYEHTVEGVDGAIVPFYLHGLWGSSFSRSSEKLRKNRSQGLKRDIFVAFGEPLPMTTSAHHLKQTVSQLSIDAWNNYCDSLDPLPLAWLRKAKSQLRNTCVIDTLSKSELSHGKMVAATTAFAGLMAEQTAGEQNIGLILPASSAGMIANMAVMLNGQTVVNLNYTSPVESVRSAIRNAEVTTVYSSKKFMAKLAARGVEIEAMLEGVEVRLLEDLRTQIPKTRFIMGLLAAWTLPAFLIYRLYGRSVELNSPAAVLFSSGSEGSPKGIVLSHRNFVSNIKQISDVLDTREDDVIMGGLPPFHSFGLTVTTLMPMVEGIPVICHPDPTDVLNVAKAISTYQATMLLGTATFLRLYAKNRRIEPLMLDSLRIVVAGAEKLPAKVRTDFEAKFNKKIYEGYGATETTPVASVNIPDRLDADDWKIQQGNKPGSVGLPVPGSCFRIVDPTSMEALVTGEDGLILIAGHQVMLRYLNDQKKTQEAIVELDGQRWYKTGDKGHLDEHGFLFIVDRYSRFAKIAGEMVSLGAVEETIKAILINEVDIDVVAVNLSDAKKGEKVVLLAQGFEDVSSLRQRFIEAGMDPLQLPTEVVAVEAIPTLGSGKKDFGSAKKLALELMKA